MKMRNLTSLTTGFFLVCVASTSYAIPLIYTFEGTNEGYCRRKELALGCLVLVFLLMLAGCGTTKNYHVASVPSGALVLIHGEADPDKSQYVYLLGETPADPELLYLEDETYYITTEKRGYERDTRKVSVQSDLNLVFDLQRIEGVSEQLFAPNLLADACFYLLPVTVDVLIHSGIGALDKHERSEAECQRVSNALNSRLRDWLSSNDSRIDLQPVLSDTVRSQWDTVATPLHAWIKTITSERLPYFSRPPLVNESVTGFGEFMHLFDALPPDQRPYLLYMRGHCISETEGRKVGNAFFGPMAAIKFGGPLPAYASDTGTTLYFYVIDPHTTEVLHLESYTFPPDATSEKELVVLVEKIGALQFFLPARSAAIVTGDGSEGKKSERNGGQ